jgi:hypothetical protein
VVSQAADDCWLFNGPTGRVTGKQWAATLSAARSPTGRRRAEGEEHRRRRERRADERRGSATATLLQHAHERDRGIERLGHGVSCRQQCRGLSDNRR